MAVHFATALLIEVDAVQSISMKLLLKVWPLNMISNSRIAIDGCTGCVPDALFD